MKPLDIARMDRPTRVTVFVVGVLIELQDRGVIVNTRPFPPGMARVVAAFDQLAASGFRPTAAEARACLDRPEWAGALGEWDGEHLDALAALAADYDRIDELDRMTR